MNKVKININQYYHSQEYFIHIDDIYNQEFNSQVEIEITISKNKSLNDNQCDLCKQALLQLFKIQKDNISHISFIVQEFEQYQKFMQDKEMIQSLLQINTNDYSIKLQRGDLENYELILTQFYETFIATSSLALEISLSKYEKQTPISILNNLSMLKNLQSFSFKLTSLKWSNEQVLNFLANDSKNIPQNLYKISISLFKVNVTDKALDILFQNLQQIISPQLKHFALALDYVKGDIKFGYLNKALKNTNALETFKIHISDRIFLDDFIKLLETVCKNNKLVEFILTLSECDLPIQQSVQIAQAIEVLSSLNKFCLTFTPQRLESKTILLKPSFEQYQKSIKKILQQNQQLKTIQIDQSSQVSKTLLDAFGFYHNMQFTNFFVPQQYPQLNEVHFKDSNYSGINRYKPQNQQDFNLFQVSKNNDLLSFIQHNPQLIKLQITEMFIDNNFLLSFSRILENMENLTHLDIEFREFEQPDQNNNQQLFQKIPNLQFVKLKVSYLNNYMKLLQIEKLNELQLMLYQSFISLDNQLLTSKAKKLIFKQKALINRLTKPNNFNQKDFTKIIVLEEGGSDLFQICPCLVVDLSGKLMYLQQQRFIFLHLAVFYKYIYEFQVYSPHQVLFDLIDEQFQ